MNSLISQLSAQQLTWSWAQCRDKLLDIERLLCCLNLEYCFVGYPCCVALASVGFVCMRLLLTVPS
jgi:hypothetical protein